MNKWPFLGTEALAAGIVTRRTLASRHDAIYRNVYMPKGKEVTAATRAEAAWLWSGRDATAAGLSAAALHGVHWIDSHLPAELYRRNGKPVEAGRRRGRVTAVVRVDALANATGLPAVDVEPLLARHQGVRGLVQLREVLGLMDSGAESPQETRTRLVLVDAGLPRPATQIIVHGNFAGRRYAKVDMGYEEFKVGIEYDGEQHWTNQRQYEYDIDRHAELHARGWLIIRVSADMLRYRPHVIVARVCAALRAAGAQWEVIAQILADRVA